MKKLTPTEEKEKELKRRMRQMSIFEKDIQETFIKSSGPGGQNVNKVATCVMLRHVPTDIQIKCQAGRTQAINRHKARELLVEKIEKKIKQERQKTIAISEKKKRQNRKRPKFLKESILESKHRQSEKKQFRKKLTSKEYDD